MRGLDEHAAKVGGWSANDSRTATRASPASASGPRWRRIASEQALSYLASGAIVAVSAIIAWAVLAMASLPHVSIIFLCAVLASGVRWGRGPALFAAILSVGAASYFFYAPIYSFAVASPQDLLDLLIFSIAAVLTSALAEEVRRRRIAAERHDAMTAKLYAFSRQLAGIADADELLGTIVESVSGVLGVDAVLIVSKDGRVVARARDGTVAAPPAVVLATTVMLRHAAGDRHEHAVHEPVGWRFKTLRRGGRNVGVLAVPDREGDGDAGARELLEALVDQAAVAIERAQLAAAIEDARVNAKTEELREALLNSVSHDLRTPLAAIIGSATSLQTFGTLDDKEATAELVATIREEGERLHALIGNILDLSRIRAGEIHPRLEMVELADIVNAALRRAERALHCHDVTVHLPDDLPMLQLDLFLMEQALVNVLENAAKYSPRKSLIEVTARLVGTEVVLEVRDHGVGIVADDLPNVFNQFYRAEMRDAKPSGTGLGLSICRAFVEANHGCIVAVSDGAGEGATFRVTLPLAEDAHQLRLRDE